MVDGSAGDVAGAASTTTSTTTAPGQSPGAASNWLQLVRAGGYAATEEPLGYLASDGAAVIPDGIKMTRYDRGQVLAWVRAGGRLVTADPTLLGELGAKLGQPVEAAGATMDGLSVPAVWATPATVTPLTVAAATAAPQVMAHATLPGGANGGGGALAVAWTYGAGKVLGLGLDPMGNQRTGYEMLPTLAHMVGTVTAAPPGPSRNGLELYLDPGVLPPNVERNVTAVAALAQGARVVNLAAWDTDFDDPTQNYPYTALIQALHARGILVYAWLEPPFVDLSMWEHDPECREKTATGVDAHIFWRYLISLETPACFTIAWEKHWRPMLEASPWDGVNVAELYFESPEVPNAFTPFSAGALALFGKDPKANLAAFMQFRIRLVTQLNQQMMNQLNGLPNAKSLDFELTVIDSLLDQKEAYDVGSDVSQLSLVAQKAGASLQIEDPFTTWSEGPLRYNRITGELKSLVQPGDGLIDLNVVDRADARPTSKMTGGELDLAAYSASTLTGRMASYAVGTIPAADQAILPYAMGAAATTTFNGIVTPWTVMVHAPPGQEHTEATVDGIQWPTADGVIVVPAGEHAVNWSGGPTTGPGLESFDAELSTASVTISTIDLAYYSRAAAYAVVSAKPVSLTVDGASAPLVSVADPGGGWAVRLPSGTHHSVLTF